MCCRGGASSRGSGEEEGRRTGRMCVIATDIGTSLLSLNVYETPPTDTPTLLNLPTGVISQYLVGNAIGSIIQVLASELH